MVVHHHGTHVASPQIMPAGVQTGIATSEKQFDNFLKAKHTSITWSSQPALWYLSNRNETQVHLRTALMGNSSLSIIWRVGTQTMVCLYDGITLVSKKGQTADACDNADEYQKHYTEWKTQKTYVLKCSIVRSQLCLHSYIHLSKFKLYFKKW